MADIGPGALLICLRASRNPDAFSYVLQQGAMYTCREVKEHKYKELCLNDGCGIVGFKLEELPGMHCPNLFRSLGDPDAEIKETSEPKVQAPFTLKEWVRRVLEPSNV